MTKLGIIEGFYGRYYSFDERVMLLNFLQKYNYDFYIYAPKNDRNLRRDYLQKHEDKTSDLLIKTSDIANSLNISFGMGISPINLTNEYEEKKDLFLERVLYLVKTYKLKILALLFDDVILDKDDLAKRQNQIIKDVEKILPKNIERFIVCPTYYTDDSILDKIFGTRPLSYYEDFAHDLDKKTEIFWTGSKVLSSDIKEEDIKRAKNFFNKNIVLWDNYPVNDGKNISNFLNIDKFIGRENLQDVLTAHAINPMLEPMLSTLPMLTLPLIYKNLSLDEIDRAYKEYAKEIFGKSFEDIFKYKDLLTKKGLNNLTSEDKNLLLDIVNKDIYLKANQEVKDFLENKYLFDPNCLTD